jgi:hypothetical protein
VLVIADAGDRGLALANRGESWRISRMDFVARRASYWLDARLHRHATTYDGATWFLAVDGGLFAVDTTGERLATVWDSREVGPIETLQRTPNAIAFVTASGESWVYEVPSYILRTREPFVSAEDRFASEGFLWQLPWPGGGIAEARASLDHTTGTTVVLRRGNPERHLAAIEGRPAGIAATERWVAVVTTGEVGSEVTLLDPVSVRSRVVVSLGDTLAHLRLTNSTLLVFDEAGRLIAVDLERGVVARDLRV